MSSAVPTKTDETWDITKYISKQYQSLQNTSRLHKITLTDRQRNTTHIHTEKKSRQEWEEEEQDMVLTEDKLIKVEFGEKCTKITNHFSCR